MRSCRSRVAEREQHEPRRRGVQRQPPGDARDVRAGARPAEALEEQRLVLLQDRRAACARGRAPAPAPCAGIAAWRSRSACDERVASSQSRMPMRTRRSSSRSSSPASTSSPTIRCARRGRQARAAADLGGGLHGPRRGEGLEHAHDPIGDGVARGRIGHARTHDTTPIGWECSCARHRRTEEHGRTPHRSMSKETPMTSVESIAPTRRRSRPPSCSSRPPPRPRSLLASPDQLSQAEITQEIIDCHAAARRPRGGRRAAWR